MDLEPECSKGESWKQTPKLRVRPFKNVGIDIGKLMLDIYMLELYEYFQANNILLVITPQSATIHAETKLPYKKSCVSIEILTPRELKRLGEVDFNMDIFFFV